MIDRVFTEAFCIFFGLNLWRGGDSRKLLIFIQFLAVFLLPSPPVGHLGGWSHRGVWNDNERTKKS